MAYNFELFFCLVFIVLPLVECICLKYPVFKPCECKTVDYLGRDQFVLNCTDVGFTNVTILANLPEETEVLIFIGNNIPELPWNLFGLDKNLTKLRVIDLSRNNISIIHGKTFHHVSSVERLILNHNQITIASNLIQKVHHPRIFSNFENLLELHLSNAFADKENTLLADLRNIFIKSELKKLRKIHLEQNDLTEFKDPKIFCDLPSIMDLHLGNNKLEGLDFDIDCLSHLRYIDLENNRISFISSSAMEKLDDASKRGLNITLDLSGNPLFCGTQLDAFYSLLDCAKINLRNKDKLKCKKVSCNMFHSNDESVNMQHNTVSRNSHALLATAFVISLILNAYFFYRRIWPRDPVGSWFKSFSQAFTSSAVHYTKQSNLDDL